MTQNQKELPSDKYTQWIKNNVTTDPYGECYRYSSAMQKEYPELSMIRGNYIDHNGKHEHWWLHTSEGRIIDPTSAQFKLKGVYVQLDESLPEPTGKCAYCGEYTYDHKTHCSDDCSEKNIAYLNGLTNEIYI